MAQISDEDDFDLICNKTCKLQEVSQVKLGKQLKIVLIKFNLF